MCIVAESFRPEPIRRVVVVLVPQAQGENRTGLATWTKPVRVVAGRIACSTP
jgi:hypothetical protein